MKRTAATSTTVGIGTGHHEAHGLDENGDMFGFREVLWESPIHWTRSVRVWIQVGTRVAREELPNPI